MLTRAGVVTLAVAIITACDAVGQAPRPIVTGRVVDELDRPMSGVQVTIDGPVLRGTLTDTAGRFALRVPSGGLLIHVRSIGYDDNVVPIRVDSDDSVDLFVRKKQTVIPFPGADLPLPDSTTKSLAIDLLRQVLQDTAVRSLILRNLPLTVTPDTILVWIPWSETTQAFVVGTNPVLWVSSTCVDCVARTSFTVEGGRQYTAGAAHINAGLWDMGDESRQLRFCVGFIPRGTTVMLNCGGHPEMVTVRYLQNIDNSWTRLTRR